MLDRLTAVTLAFLPLSLQARALADLRARTRFKAAGSAPFPAWRQEDDDMIALFARAERAADQALANAARRGIDVIAFGADVRHDGDGARDGERDDDRNARHDGCHNARDSERDDDRAGERNDERTGERDRYPALLAQIADPPFALWARGDPDALATPCLAIVGSRAASPYGIQVAHRLGADLAEAGLTIVSGLARGVDSAGHRGALTRGRTVAVLGSGVDVIYPAEHASLAAEIVERGGAVISELPPGTPPRRGNFPRRNRVISGLSLGVLVIEASERSGSLQTARFAAEQGREVLAVPGSILGERNRGAHALLRDGAILVEQAADVVNEIRWPRNARELPAARAASGAAAGPAKSPALPHGLDRMVDGEVYDFQALAGLSGLPADALLRDLLFLELDGRITRTGDGRFLRAARPVIR